MATTCTKTQTTTSLNAQHQLTATHTTAQQLVQHTINSMNNNQPDDNKTNSNINNQNQNSNNGNSQNDKDKDKASSKIGTRVFKKSSPNGKITTYLGKRDYIDYKSDIEPIDGVVLIDPDYVKERKIFAHVLAAFRYGRDDLDVLGLTFRKDLFIAQQQIYPQHEPPKNLTHLQQRLLRKLGPNAYPFFFQIPKNAPASVTLQPAPGDTGKPCGVDYELKAYCGEDLEEKPHKRNSVRLAIRKLTYAPASRAPQPMVDGHKEFMMSPAPLHLECTLDKEMYYHGESINVNVQATNNSNKTVKKIRISVIQASEIMLYSSTQYKCEVAELESTDGFPINPSSTMSKVYMLTPLLLNNKDKRGLALDGKLKHEDTNLASSTIITDPAEKENLGITVQYKVKVKLVVSLGGDLSVELPFTLTHPKPEQPSGALIPNKVAQEHADQLAAAKAQKEASVQAAAANGGGVAATTSASASSSSSSQKPATGTGGIGTLNGLSVGGGKPSAPAPAGSSYIHGTSNNAKSAAADQTVPVDLNLIEFDTKCLTNGATAAMDDDLIFEEFARIRLKGHDPDDTEA